MFRPGRNCTRAGTAVDWAPLRPPMPRAPATAMSGSGQPTLNRNKTTWDTVLTLEPSTSPILASAGCKALRAPALVALRLRRVVASSSVATTLNLRPPALVGLSLRYIASSALQGSRPFARPRADGATTGIDSKTSEREHQNLSYHRFESSSGGKMPFIGAFSIAQGAGAVSVTE